jgi:uncharacterized protein (TIGR02118 family)
MHTKITLIVANPADPDAFEQQYAALAERAAALPGMQRMEAGKVFPKDDGTPPPAYRTFDLYFEDYAAASAAVAGPEAGAFFQQLGAMNGELAMGLFTEVEH